MDIDAIAPRTWKLVTGGLAVLLMVTLVVLFAVWQGSSDRRDREGAEKAALDAAKTSAVSMTSYDYRRLDKDYAWVNDRATADFAKQYREANKPLRGIVEKLKATARGTVSEAAATSESSTEVRVLLFIDQKITNTTSEETRSDRSRVVMLMVKRDGAWLVDDVQLR